MTGDTTSIDDEPPYGWVVVWACFVALAVIFGVAYSFAAFFESFTTAFTATRADVSLVFGLSGLLYFVLGAFGGMLSDRYGPRRVTSARGEGKSLCAALADDRYRSWSAPKLVFVGSMGWAMLVMHKSSA